MTQVQFSRREARIIVLEALYRKDLLGEKLEEAIEEIVERESPTDEVKDYVNSLKEVIVSNKDEIDNLIERTSENWPLERMTHIDRAILRLAIAEMLGIADVPYKVSISEAVELAKTFSTEESGAFVNGILDAIAGVLGYKER